MIAFYLPPAARFCCAKRLYAPSGAFGADYSQGATHGKRNHHHRQTRRVDIYGRLRQAAGDSENKKGGPRRDSGPHGHRRSAGIRGPGHPGGVLRRGRPEGVRRRAAAGPHHRHPGHLRRDPGHPSGAHRPGGPGAPAAPVHRRDTAGAPHVFRREDRRPEALPDRPPGRGDRAPCPARHRL